jgi:hypothetical protein
LHELAEELRERLDRIERLLRELRGSDPVAGELLDAAWSYGEGDHVRFSASELIEAARQPGAPRLRAALVAFAGDDVNARRLGRALRKLENVPIAGLILRREEQRTNDGWLWSIEEAP